MRERTLSAAWPSFQLVGRRERRPTPTPATRAQPPAMSATDPRWVLAVRVSEALQGALLAPEDRAKLIRLGRMLGLGPFDCNLVIAIVQDQVRRGQTIGDGAAQLQLVPGPRPNRLRHAWRVASIAAAILTAEALLLWMIW